ncbi:hypothetical protein [Halorubrum sp. CSM-61]|uniref:helix-turn-helix transcriptional regulator n=1 Tax=Halorubrum sp. CSM-61 TaxID=2485838 RepID=UPI000F4B3917|nr:hypothetical protein [Halorubrum sp. CSM-61]
MYRFGEFGRVCVICLVLVVVVLSGAVAAPGEASPASSESPETAQTNSDGVAIQNVTLEGDGYDESQYETIGDHPGPPFVWQEGELHVNVTVESRGEDGSFDLCGRGFSEEGDSSVSFDCGELRLSADSTQNIPLSIDTWPSNATGNHTILLELSERSLSDDEIVDEKTVQVRVIEREGDLTGDGLTNEEEFEHGTDITTPDTSGNGLTDWEEVKKYGTNPLALDTTGDGVNDATLVRLGLDPTEPYLLHRYLAGAIAGLIAIAGTGVLMVRRRGDEDVNASDRSAASGTDGTETDRNAAGGTSEANRSPIDESILTNEEVVYRLLDENEGRMRQSQIIESTEWSKAKVSRVLSDLEEKEVIDRARIGRENVVDLRSDVDDVGVPNRRD